MSLSDGQVVLKQYYSNSLSPLLLTCMSQTESPEPEIGGRVGDTAQTVLDGVNGLVHCHVSEVKL